MIDLAKLEAWWDVFRQKVEFEWEVLTRTHTYFDLFLYIALGLVIFGIVMFYLKIKRPAYRQVGFDMKSKKEDLVQVHQRGNYTNQFDLSDEKTRKIKPMASAKDGDPNPIPEPMPDKERMKEATLEKTVTVKVSSKNVVKKKAVEIRGAQPNLDQELHREEDSDSKEGESSRSKAPEPKVKINELTRQKIDELMKNTSITRELDKKGIKKEEIDLEVLQSSGVLDGLLDTIVSPVKIEEEEIGKFSKMSLDIDLIFEEEDFKSSK